jgi:hypothetical protein
MSSNHQLTAVFNEGGVITVTPEKENLYFPNSYTFYLALLTSIRKADPLEVWNIRYAARITEENFPFLHSSSRLQIIIDPWAPYRDPVVLLGKTGILTLMLAESMPYYFKRLPDAKPIMEKRLAEDARRKIQTVPVSTELNSDGAGLKDTGESATDSTGDS